MEKKESLNKEALNLEAELKPKPSGALSGLSGLHRKSFGVIKFILGVCLLPFVYSASAAFLNEFCIVDKILQRSFWNGLITFLIIYLFIWEPAKVYARGQKILELIFSFFKPLVRVAPYLLPIYTILLLAVYPLLYLFKSERLVNYFVFLLGFSICLHLVFSAKSIRSKKEDFLKANYIFGFSFVYIINVILLSFGLNLIFKEYSFVNFFNNALQSGAGIINTVFKQLFLTK